METYLNLVDKILTEGKKKRTRTGIDKIVIFGEDINHNMSKGFPILTTKKMYTNAIFVELEGFIKGLTDKKWYQERKCNIWNEWCNPAKVPYGHDEGTKIRMKEERDLGPIYGFQWRHFGAEYNGYDFDYTGKGFDQLKDIVQKLKSEPDSTRMIVNAWSPLQLNQMALPPCHYSFTVNVIDNKLHLSWKQRSVDTMLGLPFNIASYATLLKLLAKESGFKEGNLIGHLEDLHIYINHIDKAREQLKRKPYPLPEVEITNFSSIFNWTHQQTNLINYHYHPKIEFPIAV